MQFNKEAGHIVEECKLRVLYVSPPQPPSPVPEGSEEGSSPRGSVSDGNTSVTEFSNVSTCSGMVQRIILLFMKGICFMLVLGECRLSKHLLTVLNLKRKMWR